MVDMCSDRETEPYAYLSVHAGFNVRDCRQSRNSEIPEFLAEILYSCI